jgi:hypothetical protein
MSGFPDPQVVEASKKINGEYLAATGGALDPYAMSAYCGVKEVARAIELAQSTDPQKTYAALMAHPDWNSPKGPAKWRIDGQVAYKYDSFIGLGLPADKRANKWDYLKIIDAYKGGSFMKPPSELGW